MWGKAKRLSRAKAAVQNRKRANRKRIGRKSVCRAEIEGEKRSGLQKGKIGGKQCSKCGLKSRGGKNGSEGYRVCGP